MKSFRQLNLDDRETLLALKAQGRSLREIASILNRSASTVSRELKRNRVPTPMGPAYRPAKADLQARRRLRETHLKPSPMAAHPALRERITALLKERWSPELIAGFLKRERTTPLLSHESIYRWIYAEARELIPCLLRSHPKRWHRRSLSWVKRLRRQRVSIRQRPEEVNQRLVAGHWEADLVWGEGRSALQVLVERKTRYTRLARLPDKTARAAFLALSATLKTLPPALRQSITYDNGVENLLYREIQQLFRTKAYFCDPYSAWQKGTVENTNGLIRRFLPRRTNFDTVPDQDLARLELWLNHRPRKCLNFQSPAEAFQQASVALAT